MPLTLAVAIGALAIGTLLMSPRRATVEGFFHGRSETGAQPKLITLVLSQVTTWIFARSLMNAAILGYYYGVAGTLAGCPPKHTQVAKCTEYSPMCTRTVSALGF